MPSSTAQQDNANLIGSAFMVAAMAAFAVEDALLKNASTDLPVGQVLILFGAGGALVFAALARAAGEPLFVPEVISKPMRIRAVFEIIARLFYTLAIALTPLSSATVIMQATPLVVVAGAALVFGEKVGWRRWSAIFIGVLGVMIILQPGSAGFSPLSILAVLGMLGFAGRDLASRAAPARLSTRLLGIYGFLAIVLAGVLYSIWSKDALRPVTADTSLVMAAAVAAGVVGYSCLMRAMRTGEISAVTPFRYSRLLFGVALGVIFFQEEVTLPVVIGSGLIVLSGLFILWRGARA